VTKRACVLFVDGFEEIEAVTVVDVLRRAGVQTQMVGVEQRQVVGSHGIALQMDTVMSEVDDSRFDAVILPGGMPGAAKLRDNSAVRDFVVGQHVQGAIAAAICAAPMALGRFGLLAGRRATCFPGCESDLGGATFVDAAVVDDGDVVTSRGVGTALDFALALVGRLVDDASARTLGDKMLVRHPPV
jgi:4-methyl-5(b-hydroxyethyl)-thiazole monophosphate biosynthesis